LNHQQKFLILPGETEQFIMFKWLPNDEVLQVLAFTKQFLTKEKEQIR